MFNKKTFIFLLLVALCVHFAPEICHASLEGSIGNLKTKLTRVILPSLSIIGIVWAAFSLLTGNERAKTHIWYAIIGSAIGFGAQAITDFISQTVR